MEFICVHRLFTVLISSSSHVLWLMKVYMGGTWILSAINKPKSTGEQRDNWYGNERKDKHLPYTKLPGVLHVYLLTHLPSRNAYALPGSLTVELSCYRHLVSYNHSTKEWSTIRQAYLQEQYMGPDITRPCTIFKRLYNYTVHLIFSRLVATQPLSHQLLPHTHLRDSGTGHHHILGDSYRWSHSPPRDCKCLH